MINRYTYEDPIFKASTKNTNLRIDSSNKILNIFRLISGTINCTDTYDNKVYKFRQNYSNFPYTTNETINQSVVLNNFPDEVKLKDLNEYFKRSRFNSKFYGSIEPEIIKCLVAVNKNNHLEAFFYLYRIFEGISYSIPLIYVSKQRNYDKTYKQLQSFFNNDQDGELAFFKRFISETFKNEDFFKSTIDIDFNTIDRTDLREAYYELYLEKIKEKPMNSKGLKGETLNQEIKLSFIGFYDFIIIIRNRFFHLTKGTWQNNLSSTEILFPDYFFKPIVNHGLNWIALIIFEIIKVDFEKGTK